MTNEDFLRVVEAGLHADARIAESLGARFCRIDGPELAAATSQQNPFFSSAMYDDVRAGYFMRHWLSVTNPLTGFQQAQLHVFTFFGPGVLASSLDAVVALRDEAWPVCVSPGFSLKPGETFRVELGHRVPTDLVARAIRTPCYVFNALLYSHNNYGAAQQMLARYHFHVRVDVPSWEH